MTLAACASEPAPAVHAPPAGLRARVEVRSCIPVGYGASCACTVESSEASLRGACRLESCVGSRDADGLSARLEQVPVSGGDPLPLQVELERAPDDAHYCGVLILDSGAHFRIVRLVD